MKYYLLSVHPITLPKMVLQAFDVAPVADDRHLVTLPLQQKSVTYPGIVFSQRVTLGFSYNHLIQYPKQSKCNKVLLFPV